TLALAAGAADLNGPMSSSPGAQATPAASAATDFDVNKLFAGTCGWCHSSGGRAPGRGPQPVGARPAAAENISRTKVGTTGAMPSFATAFNDQQLQAIVRYIRELKPEGATP